MLIRRAEQTDIAVISQSYEALFAHEAEYGSTTNWVKGLYPTEKTAQDAFETGTLYVLEDDGCFCGSVIFNHVQSPEYQTIDWKYPAEPEKVLVGHTLCIPPDRSGKGYGRQVVSFAMDLARRSNCKVVRLDTWEGNKPAASLYKKMGFRVAGTAPALLAGVIAERLIFFEWNVSV